MNENNIYAKATTPFGQHDPNDIVRVFYEKEMTNLLGYHNQIFLPTSLRTITGSIQLWKGRYGIPMTSIFVLKGKDPYVDINKILTPVIINFDIDGLKNGDPKFNYISSGQWSKEEKDNNGILVNPSKSNQYMPGDMIIIDPEHSVSDDFDVSSTHN